MREHVDAVVVGSGFGGSVAALRAAEKGYRVTVVESGRRFADDELPRTSWDLRRFVWAPRLGCYGVQRIHRLLNQRVPGRHELAVVPGYGHIDPIIGRNAHLDVFPVMADFLKRKRG